ADANTDSTTRMKQYNQAEQQLVNDVAFAPLFQVTAFNLYKPCIKGLVDNAQGPMPPDDWANVYISTDSPCADATQYQ
ncbi:MAG TPA: peptide ABC transporter substrate-binding protein, partial [Ktedonosporobacter sp.]|nr:peptide ABC transporter substrate-binding protein [Ktedonosporobacter sp.]